MTDPMKVLIVHAHPEPRSLNGALKDHAVSVLENAGHEVAVSDLYAMGWKSGADAADFGPYGDTDGPLDVMGASGKAYLEGVLSADILEEQRKLLWADAVILQFPLWWFTMPALLKGWVDRVFVQKFGYQVKKDGEYLRYGRGTLAGKRALLSVTMGGLEGQYLERGISGSMDDLLFPIQHGILFYTGMDVLPPFTVYDTNHMTPERFADVAVEWEQRLLSLGKTAPIAYRTGHGGDYDDDTNLLPGREDPGARGFSLHVGGNGGAE